MRLFTALFGATTLATTATLSGFFLGIAVGSAVFGERSRRWRRPVRVFGLLEMGVGLGALLLLPMLDLYRRLYPLIHAGLSDHPVSFALVKLLFAMAAVGIPAFCMGGTLPALGEAIARPGRSLGVPVGGLYAINLLGAAVGTLLVPFVLLTRLGVTATYACAVGGSIAVGLAAYVVGSATPARRSPTSAPAPEGAPARPAATLRVLLLACGSGLFTLALQALWTRMFALVHENSLHSFSVVLFVFLLGLTAGAAIARAALRRGRPPQRLLGQAWCLAGLLVVASPRLFFTLTDGLTYVAADGWYAMLGRILLLAVVTILPATIALGTALPLVLEMAGPSGGDSAGPRIGRLLAVNTLGAIAGPLLATFVMGPLLGLWWGLVVLGGLLLVAASAAGLSRIEIAACSSAVVLAMLLLRPGGLPPVRVEANAGQRLVSVREGTHGTTAVLADDRDRWITVNNAYVLGGTAASEEERWQAHLPLLLHPAPRRVAFLGLGTGITAGAALLHPVQRIVVLEIVPEVAVAARHDFADANAGLMDDPRVTVVLDDGRHYLAASPPVFDVIVQDLLVPWRTGEAPLYTEEHLRSVRRALAPEGIFCQWLPVYQLTSEQLAIIIRTFLEVFPEASLWRGNFNPAESTLALIGHAGSGALDADAIDAHLEALAAAGDPNPFLKHPAGLWLHLVGPLPREMPAWAGARRNTDGTPWIELSSSAAQADRRHAATDRHDVADLIERLAVLPLDDTPLSPLAGRHREWKAAGAALARASLVRGAEGQQRVRALLRTLPSELRQSLEVDP